jgi:hypothetical protein
MMKQPKQLRPSLSYEIYFAFVLLLDQLTYIMDTTNHKNKG